VDEQVEELQRRKLILDDFARGEYSTNWVDDMVEAAIQQDIKERCSGSRTTLIKTLQAEGRTEEDYRKQQREIAIVTGLATFTAPGKLSSPRPQLKSSTTTTRTSIK